MHRRSLFPPLVPLTMSEASKEAAALQCDWSQGRSDLDITWQLPAHELTFTVHPECPQIGAVLQAHCSSPAAVALHAASAGLRPYPRLGPHAGPVNHFRGAPTISAELPLGVQMGEVPGFSKIRGFYCIWAAKGSRIYGKPG